MHIDLEFPAGPTERPVGAWELLTGGSAGILAGFAVDLWRLGRHRSRQARAGARARWHCDRPCGAAPR
jgi:hypothetical protein